MNEDIVGDDEYLEEFSDETNENEFNEYNETKEDNKNEITKNEKELYEMKEDILYIHKKNITTLHLMNNGNTLLIGGNDNLIRVYNFLRMNQNNKNYTDCITLQEGTIAQALDVKNNYILVANGQKCFLYDNFQLQKNTIRGDMYIQDSKNTKGHTKNINSCKFHPNNQNIFITGSLDGTLRVWNYEKNISYGIENELVNWQCIKVINNKNIRNNVLSCEFNKDGDMIILGCANGHIEIRNKISNDYIYSNKSDNININQLKMDEIIDIISSKKNNFFFFTRSLNGLILHFDIRNLKEEIKSIKNISTINNKSNICFYNNEMKLIVGTQKIKNLINKNDLNYENNRHISNNLNTNNSYVNSNEYKENSINNFIKVYKGDDDMNKFLEDMETKNTEEKKIIGNIQIYDINNFNLLYEKNYDCGIICVEYDNYINQLFLGTTDGNCIINYNDDSKDGILNYLNKTGKRKEDKSFYMNDNIIYNMDDLPKEICISQSGNVFINRMKNKKVKMNPDSNTFNAKMYEKKIFVTSYENYIIDKNKNENEEKELKEENIVDILRNREKNKKEDDYFLKAYKYTQPKNIIDYSSDEEQEYSKFLKVQKCPQCGIKNCVCGYMKNKK